LVGSRSTPQDVGNMTPLLEAPLMAKAIEETICTMG